MGASPPWPSSLKFATHTAELSRAQNNLQEEGELKKKPLPCLSPSWEMIQLSKHLFASIRLHQTGRKRDGHRANIKGPAAGEGPFVVQRGSVRLKCP